MLNIAPTSFVADTINYIDALEPSDTLALMQCVLEQMDYGLALVHMTTRQIRFANRLAHDGLEGPGSLRSGLCALDGRLCTLLRTDTL